MALAQFDSALKKRGAYAFWVEEQVRFTDLDALGHVSAVRVNEYFNTARAALFHQTIRDWPCAAQLPVMKLSIVQHEKEINFPSRLDVGLVIEKFGNTSVTMAAAVFDKSTCVVIARNVFVFIDAQTRTAVTPALYIKEKFQQCAGYRNNKDRIDT